MSVDTFCDMYFVPNVADPYVYRRQARKPNGEDYYELLLVYVYYVLCFFHKPHLIMDALAFPYDMKDESVGPLKIYLGAKMKKYQVRSGKFH